MPGKYSHLKGQITQYSVEPEHQEKVNTRKEEIRATLNAADKSLTLKNMGDTLVVARVRKAELEAQVKDENLTIEAMNQMLVEHMESETLTSLKLGNGVSLSIKDDVYCYVENRAAFHQWVKETGNEDLFTVNYQTMNSLVKQKLINSEDIPPGISPYFKQGITVRGASNLDE